ncbi:Response regulator receiver domain-containing protein [Verrucomicrobium sp. GAS474]|uniref:response regulator n=1 Tax=Verrucomicrobium sp. GAS474 TaxID=1882831 RepID=UPI00087C028C|nr:response regulator [Verrucomicrobium sp. GAS474]SDT97082.1 Response regulator receiver domain-containing protein [Verrucomicrobium sp. GAS474]
MKILIVEDRELDAKLLRFVLEGSGHEVSRADRADEAMRMISGGLAPEAIVTDLDLPDADGVTLARCLGRHSATAHVPVIALTAHPDHFPLRSETRACFAAYVVKPFDTRTFASLITVACEQQRRFAEYSAVGLNS